MITFNGKSNQQLAMVLNKPVAEFNLVRGDDFDEVFKYVNSLVGRTTAIVDVYMPLNGRDNDTIVTIPYKDSVVCLFCWPPIDCDIIFVDRQEADND